MKCWLCAYPACWSGSAYPEQMLEKRRENVEQQTHELQRSLDELNPRAQTPQNAPLGGQIGSPNWRTIADALIPCVTQVLNCALIEAARTGVRAGDKIMEIVARHGLTWALPPELVPEIQMFVLKYLDLVAQRRSEIEQFLKRFGPSVRPSICYQVYHHGRTDYYYDELPPEVLNLKKTALFWIYRSANELLSRGIPSERSEWLPPRAKEMLRFLCQAKNAGQIILFSDLYREVWKRAVLPGQKPPYGSIDEAETWINTFVVKAERFIISAPDASKSADKKVLRIRGANKFKVGKEVSAELIIIERIAP